MGVTVPGAHGDEGDLLRPLPSVRPDGTSRLAAAVARMSAPVFAIMDGGHFEDVPRMLTAAGLPARSLFLGHGSMDAERHGPWFVPLPRPGDATTVLDLSGELPAVVFWSCPAGDVALHGHLRRLNQALIPRWAAAGKTGPEPDDLTDRGSEAVLFRHWDPRVLAALLPVLDEAQFSRVLGPARDILFQAAGYGGVKHVVSDPGWAPAAPGMLTIRPDQIGALTGRMADARRRRLASYLREVTGSTLDRVPDSALHDHVLASEASSDALGIATEAGQCRWAYLMYATNGEVVRRPEVSGFITAGPETPDALLELLMGEAICHMERTRARAIAGAR